MLGRYRGTMLLCILGGLAIAVPWDAWAIGAHLWGFPRENIVGLWIAGIPLEEYCFIVLMTTLVTMITLIFKHRASAWIEKG